jgi:hypothetical protein
MKNWFQPKVIIEIVKRRELSEEQLNAACAMGDGSHPLWLAVHQLIDTAEENANEDASENMDPPGLLAGYVGGSKHLRLLRADLLRRRELGLAAREKKEGGETKREEWIRKQTNPPAV